MQNTNGNVPMLPHYSEPRFQGIGQFPFRSSPQATTNTTLTTVTDGIGGGMNQVCSAPPMDPAHSMFPSQCQQLNAPPGTNNVMNNSMLNNNSLPNGMVNNGYSFRPQPFMQQTAMTKGNMQITQTTSNSLVGHMNHQINTTAGVSFPLSRPGVMPLVGQGMGVGSPAVSQRIPLPLGNVDLNSVGGFNTMSRNDGHGMISLKQEPMDMSNHIVNHHAGLEVSHADTALHERNGTTTPKGVWRPY